MKLVTFEKQSFKNLLSFWMKNKGKNDLILKSVKIRSIFFTEMSKPNEKFFLLKATKF